MDEIELDQATITYEDPDEGTVTETVDNENVVYARDHWMVKTGTDDEGNDLMHQIPKERVHRVSRNVEQFEEQAQTVRHRVESFASDIRERLPVDIGEGDQTHGETPPSDSTTVQIETDPEEREHQGESEAESES
ncbi:hypothetical protein [Halorientalis halophila]|uniref:hypothetical protein n=1 Tax=Halorientalis halophila TaxID=3108499 RepID=UPI00300B0163